MGAGTLTLTGSNTYTGGTTISAGILQAGNAAALGSTGSSLTVSTSGELDLNGCSIGVGALSGAGLIDNLSAASTSTLTVGNGNASSSFSGTIQNISGTIALVKTGAGTLTLTGSNIYTGGTTISGGTLQLGDGANNNGYLSGGVTDNTMLSFANPIAQTYSGAISGSGSVAKTAGGTLTLSGSNSYTGSTLIGGGTLQMGNSNALGNSSAVSISSGAAVLDLDGNNQTIGAVRRLRQHGDQ